MTALLLPRLLPLLPLKEVRLLLAGPEKAEEEKVEVREARVEEDEEREEGAEEGRTSLGHMPPLLLLLLLPHRRRLEVLLTSQRRKRLPVLTSNPVEIEREERASRALVSSTRRLNPLELARNLSREGTESESLPE